MDASDKVRWGDLLWVGVYSFILFGFAGISGRPLTMHEARLPETSREMLRNHEWLLPSSGGRPWLERPPLPHWVVISAMKVFGRDDAVWVVRLPSAVMGMITVVMTMLIAGRCFGRAVAVAAGAVLATCFKFYSYGSLAEDDIYLAALLAIAAWLFVRQEIRKEQREPLRWYSFFTNRSGWVWGFFVVLGVSNIAKGPLLGILLLGFPVAVFAAVELRRDGQSFLRYSWLWGWILLVVLLLAWPIWAYRHYPDVLENWKYDYLGRMSGDYTAINEPWWYYPPKLAAGLLPWTPITVIGLYLVSRRWRDRRYLWILCWAIAPLLILSIPKGKHDHYLVPFIAPWAILTGIGLVQVTRRLHQRKVVFVGVMVLMLVGYCFGEAFLAAPTDHTVDDTAFLMRVRKEVPAEMPLYIDGKLGPIGNLDFFRMQFYSRPDAVLLHNLSFLRDQKIGAPVVDVVCRQRDERLLEQLGRVERLDQSAKSHEIDTPAGRFTLFRLTFDPHLQRYSVPNHITSLQAMERAAGPWCGPALQ